MKYICQYCSSECRSKISQAAHERYCKLNPNHDAYLDKCKDQLKTASEAGIAAIKKKAAEDPLNQIKEYHLVCSKCGKEYSIKIKERMYLRGLYPKTCSSACAHSRIKSEETKQKISEKCKAEHLHICPKCGKEFTHVGTSPNVLCLECVKKYNVRRKFKKDFHKFNCKNCNKEYYSNSPNAEYCYECSDLLGYPYVTLYTKEGKRIVSNKTKQKLSENGKRLMKEGKIKPWKSRGKMNKSYPEEFFTKVLINNNISFESEKYESGYFLDFFIQTPKGKIDLEIDGKQHKERAEHDQERDIKLSKLGYLVYRIKWNEINSDEGSDEMKSKIDSFLNFYHSSL